MDGVPAAGLIDCMRNRQTGRGTARAIIAGIAACFSDVAETGLAGSPARNNAAINTAPAQSLTMDEKLVVFMSPPSK